VSARYLGTPEWWQPAVVAFWERAYPIGLDLAVAITSWQRTVLGNAQVGGHPESQHLLATAWDVSGPDQATYAERARGAGLVAIDEGDHVHVQLFQAGQVPQRYFPLIEHA
jgi:Peptidase M15